MGIKLNIDDSNFNDIYIKHLFNNQHRYQIYYGGSSSGKSVAISQRLVLDVFGGERNYLVIRNTYNTLKKSTYNEIIKIIHGFNLGEYFNISKSEMIITCKLNNKQILFAGLDDPEKIKSITPIDGVITDIWMEEATECNYQAFKQLDKRLRGRSKVHKRITMSFNPVLKDHWIYKEFFIGIWQDNKKYCKDDTRKISILKTIYTDNKFLTQDDIDALESESDSYYYQVYTLGNWGVLGNLIFTNWVVEEFDREFDSYRNGIDWGYGSDPFAFIRVHYNKKKKTLYICDELYLHEMDNEESSKLVKEKVGREIVVCDSAEPKSIADYKKYGVNAHKAVKGPGSIEYGIKFIKGLNIVVHPSCVNTIAELSKYKWKEDAGGNPLAVAVDKHNHLIDALRYALESENEKKIKPAVFAGRW